MNVTLRDIVDLERKHPGVAAEWLLWSGFAPWYKKTSGKTMNFPEFLKLRVAEAKRHKGNAQRTFAVKPDENLRSHRDLPGTE